MQNKRILTGDIGKHEEKEITLMGWVAVRRDHGKIIFIDVRDRSGIAQCIFNIGTSDAPQRGTSDVQKLRPEWVVKISGVVVARPKNMINANIASGKWEIKATALEILNEAHTPPITIDTDGYEIGEESRLKYRYLDLRRPRLQKNLIARHTIISFMRDWLNEREFIEVETPIISKSTPEGARDYLVPSRIYPGKCYALPQSPQQYKQLLMTAGLERYYQFARCFRDEDTRGDRQPEFTQLDLEMSFVDQEDIMKCIEELYIAAIEMLMPNKKISTKPFPRISYAEARKKYDSDKPDLRKNTSDQNELAFCWITHFPFFEPLDKSSGQKNKNALHAETLLGGVKAWTFTHNPFSAPVPEHQKWLMEKKNIKDIIAAQYDLVLNGYEIGGGSIRNYEPEVLQRVFEIIGYSEEQITRNFGHMLHALGSGTPPHGGIAMGIDRLLAIVMNEPNIREVIAFPKTGDARDLMMDAPSLIDKKQLNEVGLELKKPVAAKGKMSKDPAFAPHYKAMTGKAKNGKV